MLACRQKWQASEDVGIPERNLMSFDGLNDETLPDVILQDQVAQELVVGHGNAELIGKGAPGLKGEQVVGGEQGFAADDNGPEEKGSKAEQADHYD